MEKRKVQAIVEMLDKKPKEEIMSELPVTVNEELIVDAKDEIAVSEEHSAPIIPNIEEYITNID